MLRVECLTILLCIGLVLPSCSAADSPLANQAEASVVASLETTEEGDSTAASSAPACVETQVSQEHGELCLYPRDEVELALEAAPASAALPWAYWVPEPCAVESPQGRASDTCPALAEAFACQFIYAVPELSAWLGEAEPTLVCLVCDGADPDASFGCSCSAGLTTHAAGLGGLLCDHLLVAGDDGPLAITSPAALAERYAPVDGPAEALAFVELVEPRVSHLFEGYAGNPTKVARWHDIDHLGCLEARITGTRVDASDGGWLVTSYRYPDWQGGTDVTLERVEVHVTSGGVVELLDAEPICFGVVPCYD